MSIENLGAAIAPEAKHRLQHVLNSDRAYLSPIQLRELQRRIAAALEDLMLIEEDGIEFYVRRSEGKRILELRLPVRAFSNDSPEVGEDASI